MAKHISLKIPVGPKKAERKDDIYLIEKTVRTRVKMIDLASHKHQYDCLLKLYQDIDYDDRRIYTTEIRSKLNSYKQQDREKVRDISNNISYEDVIEKLITSRLRCYYCRGDVNILYNNIKQEDQWTLERINNDIGHTNTNCEICCLRCNLKRRCMPSFLYKKSKDIGKVVKLCD